MSRNSFHSENVYKTVAAAAGWPQIFKGATFFQIRKKYVYLVKRRLTAKPRGSFVKTLNVSINPRVLLPIYVSVPRFAELRMRSLV